MADAPPRPEIRILEDHVVNQIAAGEVVERPASVVKELLENALDAGARTVRVSLRGGGRSRIRITDDGCGMSRANAMMCLERHATSKIRRAEDLEAVGTLGFRGEAVPSIAAVSRFQILTRPHDEEVGTRIRVEGGTLVDVADAGCAPGTEMDVRSLFYNLPARRKFLRTVGTELSHCVEAVTREILVRPEVDLALFHDDREILRAPAVADRAARARDVLGSWGRGLQEVAFDDGPYRVEALVSPVGVHKSTPSGAMYLYVDGRFVRDPVLRRAVNEAYRDLVPKGRYPVVVLDLRLRPGLVDVNVHPSKVEVRFHAPRNVARFVSEGLRAALQDRGLGRTQPPGPRLPDERPDAPVLPLGGAASAPRATGGLRADPPPAPRTVTVPAHPDDDPRLPSRPASPPGFVDPFADLVPPRPLGVSATADGGAPGRREVAPEEPVAEARAVQQAPAVAEAPAIADARGFAEAPAGAGAPAVVAEGSDIDDLPVARFSDLRVYGPLGTRWLVCEGAGQLVVIDRRAARERALRHELATEPEERLGEAQRLLAPALVSLPRQRVDLLGAHRDALGALRIDLELFGPGEVAIRALPRLLAGADLHRLLTELSEVLTASAGPGAAHAVLARHGAVVAPDEPGEGHEALLASLDTLPGPHDRPVAVRIGPSELAARLGG